MNNFKVMMNGIIKENPTFVLLLGMCPTLGTTSSAINGMGMGLATMFVLICSNVVISLIKNLIPDMVRIPSFIVVIASFVTLLQMVMQAYVPGLYATLGLFIPLIVVNCIVLGRAEAFAAKNNAVASMFDGIGMGLGFTIALTLLGAVREFLGTGKIFDLTIMPEEYGMLVFVLAPAPWLILGATALGNGGVFCWYSYINPMLTNVSGFSAESITPLMILAGFGMVMGNLISGRLSDRYTPGKVGTAAQALICIMLLLIFFLSPYKWAAALLMCLCTAGLFAVSSPEQILIIRVSKGGEMLGAACVQVAFNLGNAIGAYAGGLAVSGGYRYPALAGVPFALIGFTLFLIFYKKYQAKY